MLQIGPYRLNSQVVLAPMAGVTDLPFRRLCRQWGAGLAVSEMITADSSLWLSRKSRWRLAQTDTAGDNSGNSSGNNHSREAEPRSVQIAGSDPLQMAEAARRNVELGAQLIDINMGCPAKKVCQKAAGSALLKDEPLVRAILSAVVAAVDVPVTLKIRTGWSPEARNGVSIARMAEDLGIQALAVHGRTRACRFEGEAEYDTIATIKAAVGIPVLANGDIDSPQKARAVLDYTHADAVMIGRAAQGRPWICREIDQYLTSGVIVAPLRQAEIGAIVLGHVRALHRFYGDHMGVKIARKHVGWYLQQAAANGASEHFRNRFNQLEQTDQQLQQLADFFEIPLTRHHKTIHQEVIAA